MTESNAITAAVCAKEPNNQRRHQPQAEPRPQRLPRRADHPVLARRSLPVWWTGPVRRRKGGRSWAEWTTLVLPSYHHGSPDRDSLHTRSIASLYRLITTTLAPQDVVSHRIVVLGRSAMLTALGNR